jgi:nitroreductase
MDFHDLVKKRCSIRKYKEIPVEEEKLLAVLEAGRLAPSAVNLQPWHFIVAREPEMRRQVAATYSKTWILTAPVIIVICGDHARSWRRGDGKDFCDVDIAIATDHMTLAAAQAGLGTCWVCKFDAMKCHELLKLPSHIEPAVLLPLGYPDEEGNMKRHLSRRPLEEVVHWDKFTLPKKN